jgi:hypothetical protein
MRMSKNPFENQLDALFAEPPRFGDTAAFAQDFEHRVARMARWRADVMAAAWIIAGGAALFAAVASLDAPTVALATAHAATALAAAQNAGGVWLLPALAVGLVLAVQALEDRMVRD